MNSTARDHYRTRMRRVLEHIDRHLNDGPTVAELSAVAAWSKYHFHRQFAGLFGIGVYKYVQLRRLKRASYQLAFRANSPTLEVALANGYETPEAFARAFRKVVGQTPTEFRRAPHWQPWHAAYQPLALLRSTHMKTEYRPDQVQIVDFKPTQVAALEHRGDPRQIGGSIRKFIAWRQENRLPPRSSATFNVVYDDEAAVAPHEFRFDLCAATTREVTDNPYGVVSKTIPGGRCAVLRHVGSDDTLRDTVTYLYAEWLPASGQEPRDFPLFFERVEFYPDVPEHEAITDVYLPLK